MKRIFILMLVLVMAACGWGIDLDRYYKIGPDADDAVKFKRDSIAVKPTGVAAIVDEYITKDMTLCTTPTVAADATANTAVLLPQTESANYIWSTITGTAKTYRKAKVAGYGGVSTWDDWAETDPDLVSSVLFSDGDQKVISLYGANVYYTINEGSSWSTAATPPAFTSGSNVLPNWAFAYGNGVMMLCEYASPWIPSNNSNTFLKVFRSLDSGNTWSVAGDWAAKVADGATANQTCHVHTVGYHAAQNMFVAVIGDGTYNRFFMTSADNGVTWTKRWKDMGVQPTRLLDYGHATRLLMSSDTTGTCQWLDVTNGEYSSAINFRDTNLTIACGYSFCFEYSEGLFWSFRYDDQSTPAFTNRYCNDIYVSYDGVNWATYFRHPATTTSKGGRYASGVAQSALHYQFDDATKWKITKPTLAVRTGILIVPAATNALSTTVKSCFTDNTDAYDLTTAPATNMTKTWDNATGWYGTVGKSWHLYKTDTSLASTLDVYSNASQTTSVHTGRRDFGRLLVKGFLGDNGILLSLMAAAAGAQESINSYYVLNCDDEWVELITSNERVSASMLSFYRRFHFSGGSNSASSDYDFWIGGQSISNVNTPFVIGGTAAKKSSLSHDRSVGTEWTSYFTVFPEVGYPSVVQFYRLEPVGAESIAVGVGAICTGRGSVTDGDGLVRKALAATTTANAKAMVSGQIRTATLGVGGTGYAAGQILTVVQSGGSAGTLTIATVNAGTGAVETFTYLAEGSGYAVANGLATTVNAGGGADCTINITAIDYWTTIASTDTEPKYHLKTWTDASNPKNRMVLYIDCLPVYASSAIVHGKKIKLDIYINNTLEQTLTTGATPIYWDRYDQWDFALSVGTAINLFMKHPGCNNTAIKMTQDDAEVTAALVAGAFKSTVINHYHGDTSYPSMSYYLIYGNNKDFAAAETDTADIVTEMNDITLGDSVIQTGKSNLFGSGSTILGN
jgi:hypothetical protein